MIFAASVRANLRIPGGVQNASTSTPVRATNEQEALGRALQAARVAFPQREGWYGHQASVCEVPVQWILEEAAATIRKARRPA